MPLFEKAPRQFYIATQNFQRVFFCGYNAINGSVVLDLIEPKRARGVFVHLIGRVRTHWTESESYTDPRTNEMKTRQVTRSDSVEILHLQAPVMLPQNGASEDFLPPGQYSFPFSFSTPPNNVLPPNFDTKYGKITYVLKANIDRPWKYDHRCFLPISLLPVADCNDPRYQTELLRQEEKTMCCCCCASGPIIASARIPVSAWCPGELVPCLVTLENKTNSAMQDISYALDCETTYHAGYHTKTDSKRVGSVKLGRQIPPQGEIKEVLYLRVPSCCPTFNLQSARLISHEYWFHVTIHLPAGSFNLHLRMPTVIGTIPHSVPPLFAEQRAQMGASAPVYSWASAEGITKAAAAAAAAPAAPSAPAVYEDAYTESADPDESSFTGQMQYVYFEMPQAPMPGFPAASASTGNERTPLMSASGPVDAAPSMTTTSSAGYASTGAAPASMFAAPCAYSEIPKDN